MKSVIYRAGGLAALLLAGCGGGSASFDGQTGRLHIVITDAPVDGVTEVWVEFTGAAVKPKSGPAIDIEFDTPRQVELLALAGDATQVLIDGEELPAGEYNWLRLDVSAEIDGIFDSYAVLDTGGQVEIEVPTAGTRGLQLGNGFLITANGETGFIADWDVRQGMVDSTGQPGLKLKPTIRIIDETEHGAVEGIVAQALITDASCTADPNTGAGNVVYVFAGAGVTPDDMDGIDPDPVTTGNVRLDDDSGEYTYRVPFLPPGAYTVAFTCQGADDTPPDPDDPNLDPDDPVAFSAGVDVVITDGQTTVADIA